MLGGGSGEVALACDGAEVLAVEGRSAGGTSSFRTIMATHPCSSLQAMVQQAIGRRIASSRSRMESCCRMGLVDAASA